MDWVPIYLRLWAWIRPTGASYGFPDCLIEKRPIGASLMHFSQWLGGSVFVSVGQNLLNNMLIFGLKCIPAFSILWVTDTGATNLKASVPPESLAEVHQVYDKALLKVFDVAVALSCPEILGAVFMEWTSVKTQKEK